MKSKNTSWQKVSMWYGGIVGDKGHFFHQTLVIPNSLRLLELKSFSTLLDVACGQGVLARAIDKDIKYVGIDKASDLITEAKKRDKNPNHKYMVADATRDLPIKEKFDRAAIILALQNIKDPEKAISKVSNTLQRGARLLIVLNHPAFRIPRQSSWGEEKDTKLQFRRVNRYLSSLEIPINAHPSKANSPITWSYHHPIEDYSKYLFESDCLIEKIEEWSSDKVSVGKKAKQENRARDEFPMFMAILAIKR